MNRNRDAVRHAVGDAQELDRERADLHTISRLDADEPRLPGRVVVFELVLDQRERQRRPVHGALEIGQHVGHGADMVLVAVRQHERRDPVLLQLPQVGDDQIDPEQFRLREHHARVHEDRRVAAGDDHHVHAELAKSAERDQIQRREVGS